MKTPEMLQLIFTAMSFVVSLIGVIVAIIIAIVS
ncbi:hypothetical protein J2W47_005474 [Priestia megaterium]|nr:hypothetical protein [Priestia megaterium]